MPVTYFQDTLFFTPEALDAPGTTAEFPVWENNLFATSTYSLIVTVTNIDSNVVVRLEGTIDNTNWGALISSTVFNDGTYHLNINGAPVKKIRGNFLSESGGTNAIVKMSMSAR
jgi:hypothetical protein